MRWLFPVLCSILLPGAGCFAESWTRVSSPRAEVVTDAGPETAAAALRDIDFLHWATASFFPQQPARVRVFLPRAEALFRDFRVDQSTQGVAHSRGGEDWIIAYAANPDWRRILKHEYVHLLLARTAVPWPAWAEEGQAEFYSTLRAAGGRLRIGDPVPAHLRVPADRVLDLDRGPEEAAGGLFYAQSWALVHHLLSGSGGQRRWAEFARLLLNGDPVRAVQEAFGGSVADLLRRALQAVPRAAGSAGPEFESLPDPPLVTEALAFVDAGLLRAQLLLETGNLRRGEELIRRLAREHARSTSASAALAALNRDREALRRIAAADPDNAAVLFELATVLRDERSPEAAVLLRRVAALNPRHAEARHLLGLIESEAGRWDAAAGHLREAALLRPRQAIWWHALAYAEWKAKRREPAGEAARNAAAFAATPAERSMAEALIAGIAAPAGDVPAPPQPREPVQTPRSWSNGEDARIQGLLTRVQCQDGDVYLTVVAGEQRLTLKVADPKSVNTPSGQPFEFRCGTPEKPAKVSAGYQLRTLILTSIELL